jgi:diguanylate cyclase (GGDEF)-like protein
VARRSTTAGCKSNEREQGRRAAAAARRDQDFSGCRGDPRADGRLIACSDLYARLATAADTPENGEFQAADGRWLRRSVRPLPGGGSVELVADVTELRRAEQAARFLDSHDAPTGLPNRRLFDDRLRQAIRLAQRRDRMVATLLVRLDDFREASEALGHGAADAVLREVAQRLASCMRKADTVARTGADEFAIVICDLKDEADCRVVTQKLQQVLAAEFRSRQPTPAGWPASIGSFALSGRLVRDGEALLRNADAAMYRARQLGRNQVGFFGR